MQQTIIPAHVLRAVADLLRSDDAALSRYADSGGEWTIIVARTDVAARDLTKRYEEMKTTSPHAPLIGLVDSKGRTL